MELRTAVPVILVAIAFVGAFGCRWAIRDWRMVAGYYEMQARKNAPANDLVKG